jgi:hypothetical protein
MSEDQNLPPRQIRGNPEIQPPNKPRPPQTTTPPPDTQNGKPEK